MHLLKKEQLLFIMGWSLCKCKLCFFQETNSNGISYPVHITVLCYPNSQLQGNVTKTDWSCHWGALVDVLFSHALTGSLKRHTEFVVNSPLEATVLRHYNYSLSEQRHATLHHRERKASLLTDSPWSLEVYLFNVNLQVARSCTLVQLYCILY